MNTAAILDTYRKAADADRLARIVGAPAEVTAATRAALDLAGDAYLASLRAGVAS
jgi:hypothetical protein